MPDYWSISPYLEGGVGGIAGLSRKATRESAKGAYTAQQPNFAHFCVTQQSFGNIRCNDPLALHRVERSCGGAGGGTDENLARPGNGGLPGPVVAAGGEGEIRTPTQIQAYQGAPAGVSSPAASLPLTSVCRVLSRASMRSSTW